MSNKYYDTVQFKNESGTELRRVWVKVKDGTSDPTYLNTSGESIPENETVDFNGRIEHIGSKKDKWTISFVTEKGQLWGTTQGFEGNLPKKNTDVTITVNGDSEQVTITDGDGKSVAQKPVSRL